MLKTPIILTFEEYLTYDDGTDNRYELVTEFRESQKIISRIFPKMILTAQQILSA
jgi:Uma2 family endonuclease